MRDTKQKYFSNPLRKQSEKPYTPYVPQYQLKGIEPMAFDNKTDTHKHINVLTKQHKAQSASTIVPQNVEYAEVPVMTPAAHMIVPPNTGNNMEHSWHGALVSEDEIDDRFIDNNEVVNLEDLQMESAVATTSPQSNNPFEVAIGECLLLIESEIVAIGSQQYIQDLVEMIVFGQHPEIPQMDIEKLIVLQRKEIKAGVFLA